MVRGWLLAAAVKAICVVMGRGGGGRGEGGGALAHVRLNNHICIYQNFVWNTLPHDWNSEYEIPGFLRVFTHMRYQCCCESLHTWYIRVVVIFYTRYIRVVVSLYTREIPGLLWVFTHMRYQSCCESIHTFVNSLSNFTLFGNTIAYAHNPFWRDRGRLFV